MITVISHFYNEEFLLPYWIRHHLRMVDHGIMIDYHSTDRSIEIIRELAPNWEIRKSRNNNFEPDAVDAEVMDIEKEIKGWKIALNTTEFIVHHDIKSCVVQHERDFPLSPGMQTAGIIMSDSPTEFNQPVDDRPLFFQRRWGQFEPVPTTGGSRHRLLHRASTGQYYRGRHWTMLGNQPLDLPGRPIVKNPVIYRPDIYCLWFGWSPYPQVKKRKMQIVRWPPKPVGTPGHQLNDEQMDAAYQLHSNISYDLWANPEYMKTLELVKTNLYPEIEWSH